MHAVIDTNVLIYDVVEDSEFHKNARDILDSLRQWLIPIIAIYEFVWFFRDHDFSVNETKELLEQYICSPKCKVVSDSGEFTKRAFELLDDLSLSRFNDMVILAVAERYKTLATFDRKLRSKAKKLGIVIYP
jgi:predicted nucleic acid-binding protein